MRIFGKVILCAVCGSIGTGLAGEPNKAVVPPQTQTRLGEAMPPTPPRPRSPIERFRDFLIMNPAQRERALAGESEGLRTGLRKKLEEYDALLPDERELRLRMTELRWYLLPLMRMPRASRDADLAAIPTEDRKLVEQRLQEWDILPPPLQKEVLEYETTMNYFMRLDAKTPAQQNLVLKAAPAERQQVLEENLSRWRALPPDDRQQMFTRFQRFFALTEEEKKKTLKTLSESERKQMEQTLQTFENLSLQQRRACIESFYKFANLSDEDRAQFLKSAERWQAMSPNERQAWRDLVAKLPSLASGLSQQSLPVPGPTSSRLPMPSLPGQKPNTTPPPLPSVPQKKERSD